VQTLGIAVLKKTGVTFRNCNDDVAGRATGQVRRICRVLDTWEGMITRRGYYS
jgi:hypothetical protein